MSLAWPMFAMVALVLLVWLRLYQTRIGEMKRRRIHPQSVASNAEMTAKIDDARASDNFRNLFELPVLFYAGCLLALATRQESGTLLALAWTFVALRYLHSFIHCTYNKVMHRFQVYVLGGICLFGFWGVLMVRFL
ncbi:MAPEG family protein [Arenimonas sp.]|uniref:MAPEG family protein n=1 Tax=Arenimonas sp. TaxID=1872635 RepID=UPI0039E47D7B